MSTSRASRSITELVRPTATTPADVRALPSVVEKVASLGLRLAVIAGVGQALIHLVNFVVFDARWTILDSGFEKNIPTWASAGASFTAAVAALLCAEIAGGPRRLYLGLAGILAFFSLDDSVGLHELIVHENVGEVGTLEHAAGVVWPVLYLPLLVTGLVLLVRAARSAFPASGRSILIGLGLLVAAVPFEVVGVALLEAGFEDTSFVYAVQVAIEEAIELAGWILVAAGLIAEVLGRIADRSPRSA
jgi:hypothetical protein